MYSKENMILDSTILGADPEQVDELYSES